MTDYFELLRILAAHEVDFIVVGGVAAVLRAVPVQTFDLDIVHARNDENIQSLLAALTELDAVARHRPQRPRPNASHFVGTGHILLTTRHGNLDVLCTIDDGAGYDELKQYADELEVAGETFRVLGLRHLADVKRRAGRPKDLAVVPLIEHIIELSEEE